MNLVNKVLSFAICGISTSFSIAGVSYFIKSKESSKVVAQENLNPWGSDGWEDEEMTIIKAPKIQKLEEN